MKVFNMKEAGSIMGSPVLEIAPANEPVRASKEGEYTMPEGSLNQGQPGEQVLAVIHINTSGFIQGCSQGAAELFGYTCPEIIGQNFSIFYSEDDCRREAPANALASASRNGLFKEDSWRIRKDGSSFWGQLSLIAVPNEEGSLAGFVCAVTPGFLSYAANGNPHNEKDSAELRLRLIDSYELEQLLLARHLHEGILQDLYSVSYQIQAHVLESSGEAQPDDDIIKVQDNIAQIVSKLRNICRELRPPSLLPYGLDKAIRSHAESVSEENPGLTVQLNLTEIHKQLPQRVGLALFRIYQQAMQNIYNHSDAKNVEVKLLWDAEQLVLEVKDDGRGFKVPPRWLDFARQGYLGLTRASERAEAIGGVFSVSSDPGEGTVIRVQVPASNVVIQEPMREK